MPKIGEPPYRWMGLACLSLDDKRVIIEKQQAQFIAQLNGAGFDPIAVAFRDYYPFGGGMHYAALDARRRGTLKSYVAD